MSYWRGLTIEDRLVAAGHRPSGFDYLRFVLATSIIAFHAPVVTQDALGGIPFWGTGAGTVAKFILPMFFSLSGFLVAGSLERNSSLIGFYTLRALRIVPALAVEVAMSALILGPILTSKSLTEYFSAPEFRSYFFNMIGYIHYRLPGVFHDNPLPDIVNQQLWTIPSELGCYLALGALAVASLVRRRGSLIVLVVAGQIIWAIFAWRATSLTRAPIAPGGTLILAFTCGVAFYRYKTSIKINLPIFISVTIASLYAATLPRSEFLLSIPACYMTVFLGLLNPPRHKFIASGDYSYGLFLYGFPIQQVVALMGSWTHHWWINFIFAYPVTLAVAILSWHKVEKPALALRKAIPTMERMAHAIFRTEPLLIKSDSLRVLGSIQSTVRLLGILFAGTAVLLLINASDGLGVIAASGAFAAFVGSGLLTRLSLSRQHTSKMER